MFVIVDARESALSRELGAGVNLTQTALSKRAGDDLPENAAELCDIWDTVVDLIVQRMLEIAGTRTEPPHINLREEMALELGQLLLMTTQKVVEDRLGRRPIDQLSVEVERAECLGDEGMRRIDTTARLMFEHVWLKFYEQRWKPKTDRAIRNEENPPPKKALRPHPGKQHHYIAKSFIRRGWASGDKILRFQRDGQSGFRAHQIPFGAWGHGSNLYSPHREAYFGLIEGDAMPCIARLLAVKPLNRPQKEAVVGFIIIQRLRNPYFMMGLNQAMRPLVAEMVGGGKEDDPTYMRAVYESLYGNNDLYHRLAIPFFKNRWAIVRSETHDFVLPDVSAVSGTLEGKSYTIAPLTSRDCLVLLPEEDMAERILPHYVRGNADLLAALSAVLIANTKREFIANVSFKLPDMPDVPAQKLVDALTALSKHCIETQDREERESEKRRARQKRILNSECKPEKNGQ